MTSSLPTVHTRTEHENYLGVARLVLSLLVLYSHSFPLSGEAREPIIRLTDFLASRGNVGYMLRYRNSIGDITVDTFFVISGYLILQSWLNSKSAKEFSVKRIARIYPGYWVACLFSIFIGTVFSRPYSVEYLMRILPYHDAILRGFVTLSFGAFDSALTLRDNPHPHMVNGSLWTLQSELICYLLVLFLGSFTALKRSRGIIIAFIIVLFGLETNAIIYRDASNTLWRFFFDFFAGMMVFLYRDSWPFRPFAVVLSLLGLIACAVIPILFPVLYPICFGYLLICFGFRRPPAMLRWKTDLSYGVYIYAFPIQQACVANLDSPLSAIVLTAMSTPIVLFLAWLSWRYVEQPAIQMCRDRYIRPLRPMPSGN